MHLVFCVIRLAVTQAWIALETEHLRIVSFKKIDIFEKNRVYKNVMLIFRNRVVQEKVVAHRIVYQPAKLLDQANIQHGVADCCDHLAS